MTARTCNLKCWVAGLPGDLQRWQRLPGPRRWVEALHRAERRGGGAAATEDAHRATRLDGSCAPTWYLHKAKSTAKCCGWCWVQVGDVDPLFGVKAVNPFGSPSHLQRCQDAPSSRLRIEAFHTPQSCLPRAVAATSHIDATVGCCSCTAVAPGVQTRQSIPETAGGTLSGPSVGKM